MAFIIFVVLSLLTMNTIYQGHWPILRGPSSVSSNQSCMAVLKKTANHRDDISHEDHYRWLESNTPERSKWLAAQKGKTSWYLGEIDWKYKGYWHSILRKQFDAQVPLRIRKITDSTEVRLMDQGFDKPMEVIVYENGKPVKTLFSSFKDGRLKDHSGVTNFWLDPTKKFVLVPVAYNGSTDLQDIHVINIASGEQVDLIQNANNGAPVWVSQDVFVINRLLERDYISISKKVGSPVEQIYALQGHNIKNSPRGTYAIFGTNSGSEVQSVFNGTRFKVNFRISDVEAETDSALYVTYSNSDGWEELRRIDLHDPSNIKKIATEKGVLLGVFENNGQSLASYMLGTERWAYILDDNGDILQKVKIPNCCDVVGFKKLGNGTYSFIMSSQVQPKKELIYDFAKKSFAESNIEKIMLTDEAGREFVNSYVETTSKDGGKFPVRVTHLKGMKLDGNNPALVEGYGGFGVSGYFSPSYDKMVKELLDHGGVYVAPALRGGNEMGPAWRMQATLANKQNTFNDMIATMERVQSLGYTSPQKTAIMGWSNGGLLIGAVTTQAPDHFKLGIVGNGVLDLLRKDHLDPRYDDGWSYEYGNLESQDAFKFLKAYSPVHNTPKGQYPTVLVVNGTTDSRVNPVHSFKFAAALQDAQEGEQNILLLPIKNSGHFVRSEPLEDSHAYEALLYIWSSIFSELGVKMEGQ